MKQNSSSPRRSVAALLLTLLVWTSAYAAPAPPTPAPSASPKADVPYYANYVKDPRTLGFKPDAALFDRVKRMVDTRHPDKPTADKLYAGVAKEVGALLKEAGVSADGLQGLPRNESMPREIEKRYSSKIDDGLLWFAMIRGLLAGTGDPYSNLMPPTEWKMMMDRLNDRSFAGVGIVIELDKDNHNQLTVVEPVEGTPAFKAGLQAGDVILKIDGKPTADKAIEADVAAIRGPLGSSVVLTIKRKGQGEKDFTIVRDNIKVQSVTHRMLPDNIGYIRLSVFGTSTGPEFSAALDKLTAAGAKGLIVDLRNNGGGYLTAATDVCSHFIDAGKVVTFTKNRAGERSDEIAQGGHSRVRIPVVLLVNNYSASASEITAGCLKDNKAATLVGVKTFGKGSVQQLMPLTTSEAALKLTVAHFFSPAGHEINHVGVQPDVKVEMEARNVGRPGKDTQLQKAVEILVGHHS